MITVANDNDVPLTEKEKNAVREAPEFKELFAHLRTCPIMKAFMASRDDWSQCEHYEQMRTALDRKFGESWTEAVE